MKIIFNETTCASVGMCESIAPEYFEIAPTGELNILNETPAQCDRSLIERAVAECPTGSLRLQD